MANPDRSRKLLVRSALVTSATIATFVGAQSLAMLDADRLAALFTPTPEIIADNGSVQVSTPLPVEHATPDLVIQQAAPSIIILRRAGEPGASGQASGGGGQQSGGGQPSGGGSVAVIQPPAPAQLAAPDPIIVQQQSQPVPQASRSSR